MNKIIGIRRETKDDTEQRAPLTPEHVKRLINDLAIKVLVQPAEQRVFKNEEYRNAGALIKEDISEADFIFGVKEVPIPDLIENKTFIFFSHTIKGQNYNMPLLKEILRKNITLIDYEVVKDSNGKRLIFFGQYAGIVGMIDSLWLFGKRLQYEKIDSPFLNIKQAINYSSLKQAEESIAKVGKFIKQNGLPDEITPMIVGFTGRGNVSHGAQKILDLLPVKKITPDEVKTLSGSNYSNKVIYAVEFYLPDIYYRTDNLPFEREHFRNNPHKYKSKFFEYLEYLSILVNGIYWQPEYDRLITKEYFAQAYSNNKLKKLKVIGDVTCDIEGSVELTVKATKYVNPSYVYEPLTGNVIDGWEGDGPVILAVDKLPTELPRDASNSFGNSLINFIPQLLKIDFSQNFENLNLPPEFTQAVIAHNGSLTPQFNYLKKFLT